MDVENKCHAMAIFEDTPQEPAADGAWAEWSQLRFNEFTEGPWVNDRWAVLYVELCHPQNGFWIACSDA